jgi:hypothetical protein
VSQQQKQYAALAPIMAMAGVFAHPAASTVLPLILYFIFRWRNMDFAGLVALRSADIAFSVLLFLMLGSVLLTVYVSYKPMPQHEIQGIIRYLTLVTVGYLIISLAIGIIQAFRGKATNYWLSLRIAERILSASTKH